MSIPSLNIHSLIMQQPALEALLDWSEPDDIFALMQTAKDTRKKCIVCLLQNPRLIRLFKERIAQLEIESDSLQVLFFMEREFKKLTSPKRFIGEIIKLVPFVGEYVGDYFGCHLHIPTIDELQHDYADIHHFAEAKAKLLEEYANGTKIDHLETICTTESCFQVWSKDWDLSHLDWMQMNEFIANNWKGIGLSLGKIALVKVAPLTGFLFTGKKVVDIGLCYMKINELFRQGMCAEERKVSLLYQRMIRVFSADPKLKRRIVDAQLPDYRQWVGKLTLTHFKKHSSVV